MSGLTLGHAAVYPRSPLAPLEVLDAAARHSIDQRQRNALAAMERLDALMRSVREDGHEISYQDLIDVRGVK